MEPQEIAPPAPKSPEEIEREMAATRESMSTKVAALEDQVLGTVHTAANAISSTVEAVKTIVNTGPSAISDTVQQSVAAVSEAVKKQFDIGARVRENPWGAVTVAASAGLLIGFLSKRSRPDPVANAGHRAFASLPPQPASPPGPSEPGLFDEAWTRIRTEIAQLAERAFNTATSALRDNIKTEVPKLIDGAVRTHAPTLNNRLEKQLF